jgi:hypothetical protein
MYSLSIRFEKTDRHKAVDRNVIVQIRPIFLGGFVFQCFLSCANENQFGNNTTRIFKTHVPLRELATAFLCYENMKVFIVIKCCVVDFRR